MCTCRGYTSWRLRRGDSSTPALPAKSGIGAAGGTVSEASGAQIVIPAGALSVSTPIAVTQDSTGAPALPAGVTAAGPIYAFTPHGTDIPEAGREDLIE